LSHYPGRESSKKNWEGKAAAEFSFGRKDKGAAKLKRNPARVSGKETKGGKKGQTRPKLAPVGTGINQGNAIEIWGLQGGKGGENREGLEKGQTRSSRKGCKKNWIIKSQNRREKKSESASQ